MNGAVRLPSAGRWRIQLVARGRKGVDRTGTARSSTRTFHGRNPHSVPASAPHYIVQARREARLYYYEKGQLMRVLPVVFGKPSTPTPVGNFRVYAKTPGPSIVFGPWALWYHGNYGIHGTNQEHLLRQDWRYFSAGCTRNYNDNIVWLYERVPVGTPIAQPPAERLPAPETAGEPWVSRTRSASISTNRPRRRGRPSTIPAARPVVPAAYGRGPRGS